jgi:glycosyltransferase involved in cell wall biosynthesis
MRADAPSALRQAEEQAGAGVARLNIVVVSNLYPPQHIGGAEVVAHRHARLLSAEGHRVRVLSCYVPGLEGDAESLAQHDGIAVTRVPFGGWDAGTDFRSPVARAALRALLTEEPADIVHFHNLRGLGVELLAEARRQGARTVVTLHDHWGHCLRATRLRPDASLCTRPEECALACSPAVRLPDGTVLPQRLRRDAIAHALEGAGQLVAPSRAIAGFYREAGFEPGRLAVCSNGIDVSAFRSLRRCGGDKLRFAALSGLFPHKGIAELLEASALLWREDALRGRWSLTIYGDGPLRAELERRIAAREFGDAVAWGGKLPRSAVPQMLQAVDVAIVPSRCPENEPLVLLEAIAAGAAQIATASGGNAELVAQGRSGLLVPPRDAAALAGAMLAYLRAPSLAAAHGGFNLARRESFDERRILPALTGLYQRLLPGALPAPRPRTVICTGGTAPPAARQACDHLFRLEGGEPALRLLWHAWAEEEDWQRASLLWDWGEDAADIAARARAHAAGLPVLTAHEPAGGETPYAGAAEAAAALLYGSEREAIWRAIAASLAEPACWEPASARKATSLASSA